LTTTTVRRFATIAVALALLATACGNDDGGSGAQSAPTTAPASEALGPDPFDSPTAFCETHTPPPGTRNSSSPGVTPDSILIGDLSLDTEAFKKFGTSLPPYHDYFQAAVDEINDCGGINGRTLEMRWSKTDGLTKDLAGQAQAQCIKLAEEWKVFIALGIGTMGVPLPQCLTIEHRTIDVVGATGQASTADFAAAKGRLVSTFAPADAMATAFLTDAFEQDLFDGHTVAVVGLGTTPAVASDLQKLYIAPMKERGIDAHLEIAPCVGGSCKAQLGAVVGRLKQRGIDLIVLDRWFFGNMGVFQKAMASEGLQARMVGPGNQALHGDAGTAAAFPDSGPDGAAWSDRYGYSGLVTQESELTGTSRAGVKGSTFATTCQEMIGRRLEQPPMTLTEEFVKNGAWGTAMTACSTVRAIAKAIYSLGNNVTTERAAAALAKVTVDQRYEMAPFRRRFFYSGTDVMPTRVADVNFHYPCAPAPKPEETACFLPAETPVRVRSIS
jgi:hypothetical protein